MSLYDAAAFLIGAGLSMAFALVWLRVGARRRQRVFEAAGRLRTQFEADPLQGLQGCEDWLTQAGLASLEWHGDWYGVPVHAEVRSVRVRRGATRHLERRFSQPDVDLCLRIGLQGVHGEARLFAEQAAQWFFLVMEGALASRELALNASMAQRARLAVFVQHDMRNLAQWIELVAQQLDGACSPGQLAQAARSIQLGASAARERAQRIAQAIGRGAPVATPESLHEALDIEDELARAAAMHQVALDLEIQADARSLRWDRHAWTVTVDNVLGNISRLARECGQQARCAVRVRRIEDETEVSFATSDLPLQLPLARLFEPWVGTRPAGSGIGLYQARRTTLAAGGQLTAQPCGQGLALSLRVPCKKI